MKPSSLILILSVFSLVACVSEPKSGDNNKNFATQSSSDKVESKPALTTNKETLPGHIVVKCRIQSGEVGKLLLCGPTVVKLTNEFTKIVTEYTFKGDRGAIPTPNNGSYILEASTKGCPDHRKFLGMTSGMGLTAQFDNCTVK